MARTVFVTGAAGFIGSRVARVLRDGGDEVIAMVREPERQAALRVQGVRLVAGDLGSAEAVRAAMTGSDAVIHLAGRYEVGIPVGEHPAMYEANVGVTERVLDAAIAQAIPRIVQISTIGVLGNSHGEVHDETFQRDLGDGFLSYYDETKYRAHVAATTRIAAGAPIVIAMPGTVYGPHDHSAFGVLFSDLYHGRAHYVALGDAGVSPTYVDDLAGGLIAAMERGRPGESYVLAGENMRLRDAFRIVAHAAGRRPPRLSMPSGLIRFGARIAPNGGRLAGLPPNLAEIARASAGVTYWASSAKAQADLGYRTRDLERGARDAYGRP